MCIHTYIHTVVVSNPLEISPSIKTNIDILKRDGCSDIPLPENIKELIKVT